MKEKKRFIFLKSFHTGVDTHFLNVTNNKNLKIPTITAALVTTKYDYKISIIFKNHIIPKDHVLSIQSIYKHITKAPHIQIRTN